MAAEGKPHPGVHPAARLTTHQIAEIAAKQIDLLGYLRESALSFRDSRTQRQY